MNILILYSKYIYIIFIRFKYKYICVDLKMAMSVCQLVHHFGPDYNISTTIQWIALKFERH